MSARVLIIEDEPSLSAALEIALRRRGYAVDTAASARAGLSRMSEGRWDAVVVDIGLPDRNGLELVGVLRAGDPELPLRGFTAHGHLENAIAARRAGAADYMVKPLDLKQFQDRVAALLEAGGRGGKAEAAARGDAGADLFVGGALSLQLAFAAIARACAGDAAVLVTGPSGSGKSLVAGIIHRQSRRGRESMAVVEAGELREAKQLGAWLSGSGGGSLIVEEVACLAGPLQEMLAAHLLREGGGVRVMATSGQDLREAIRRGQFREDLYYQLSPGEVPLPPLRERLSDIPALCAALSVGMGEAGIEVTDRAMGALQSWSWPGNVRELRQVLRYAREAAGGPVILRSHLPPHIASCGEVSGASALDRALGEWLADPEVAGLAWNGLVEELEQRLLAHLLPKHGNKPSRLAAALGLHRSTLRQKLTRMAGGREGS
jgi:DNA-binding NtrC family response regulator